MSLHVDGQEVRLDKHFPDGTYSFYLESDELGHDNITILWKYSGEHEVSALIFVVGHLRDLGYKNITLELPYIPNARMDRVKYTHDVFTLKHFCNLINSLNFNRVEVFDPHSAVSTAMLDRVRVYQPHEIIAIVVNLINDQDLAIFYPDEGAMKRYAEALALPCAYGVKRRNWITGEIEGLDIINQEACLQKNVLIIDDICCKGGTFYHSAAKLKTLGAKDIFLYCSHCEDTIFKGNLIASNNIKHIFTTNSIFSENNDKITIIDWKCRT